MGKTSEKQKEPASLGMWGTGRLLGKAFSEQERCMSAVYALAAEIVRPPQGGAPEYDIRLGDIPSAFFTLRKNIFSTLFYSLYLVLGIPHSRRVLYGKLNHLFRMWVTSADNLLDDEDKCVLPLVMPGSSRVMREVVVIMAADRVLGRVLNEAVVKQTLTARQADALSEESLRCLLPSAAQEASEEGGIGERPESAYVLDTVHVLKTGLLFNIPFLGIDVIETGLDGERILRLKRALMLFGGGCQILDDVRDVARDFVERRHNYVLSVLARAQPEVLKAWEGSQIKPGDRLYREVLPESLAAALLGFQKLVEACEVLRSEGVVVRGAPIRKLALSMFTALDVEDLTHVCDFT